MGVGLLDLGLGLGLEDKEGALHGGNGITELLLGVGSGLLNGGGDGGTSLGGVEAETLNLGVGALGQLGDLRGDLHVEGSLGLLVHLSELLLGGRHAGLTLGDGGTDGGLELGLVGGHDVGKVLAASSVLDGVSADNAGELVDLLLELLVVVHDGLVEGTDALGEVVLGGVEGVLNVEAGTTGLLGELLVGGHLGALGLLNSGVQLGGLLSEHVGGVGAVLVHGGTDLLDLHHVVGGHDLHALVGGGLVGLDESLELLVLLQVLLVALVAELDHAVGLSVHIGVDLSLGGLVLAHSVGELVNTEVGLVDLVLDSGRQLVQRGLEGGLGSGNTSLGLGLGSGDVLHGLSETLVVESLEGVQGGSHLGRGSLKGEVSVVTVLGHLLTDTAELGSGGSHDDLHLVVGPLAD